MPDLNDIEPLPDGPNPITDTVNRVRDPEGVLLRAGSRNAEFPVVSDLMMEWYDEGEQITIPRDKAKRIEDWFARRISGYQMSLVMVCHEKCPYHAQCPLATNNVPLPVGRPCPLEAGLFKAHVVALCEELKVDPREPAHFVDYNILRDVAATEMLIGRLSMEIAQNPRTIIREVVGIDGDGNAVFRDEISKRYERLDQLHKKKMQLLESLSATRKERIKAGVKTGEDPSTFVTQLLRKSQKMITVEAVVSKRFPDADENGMVELEFDPSELDDGEETTDSA